MKKPTRFCVVLVTAPNIKVARKLAKIALTLRAVACANLIPQIESRYWWKNKIEKSVEVLILFKTHVSRVQALEKLIIKNHPYDTPEVISLNITAGNQRYLAWLTNEIKEKWRKNAS